MRRQDKIKIIRRYASDLAELAKSYIDCAVIAEKLPDTILNAMVKTASAGNASHAVIADDLNNDMETLIELANR